MANQRVYLDIHAIQTLPPCNINRDDAGSPKTAQYGGVRRARVSSQAWKRAMRQYFEDNGSATLGVRTTQIVSFVADEIQKQDPAKGRDDAMALAEFALNSAVMKKKGEGKKNKKKEEENVDAQPKDKKEKKEKKVFNKDEEAKALFFIGRKQAPELAKVALDYEKKSEEEKAAVLKGGENPFLKALSKNPDIDIALFGRMLADCTDVNVDAATQVAHAISTHEVSPDFDYFTALDDLATSGPSAKMLGTSEFSSETLYRYANVDVHELNGQLENADDTIAAVKLFVEAFSNSMPTGKIHSYANATLPHALLVTVRTDRPVSLVDAYESPVKSANGYAEESIERMFSELEKTEKFVSKPVLTLYLTDTDLGEKPEGKEEQSLADLLKDLDQIRTLL